MAQEIGSFEAQKKQCLEASYRPGPSRWMLKLKVLEASVKVATIDLRPHAHS